MMLQMFPPHGGAKPRLAAAPGRDDAPEVPLRIYTPDSGAAVKPCVYYIHGGGFVAGSAAVMDAMNWDCAQTHGAVVVAVGYRLAPETPFPGPIEDCYAGLLWVMAHAAELGIDPGRVIVMGHSAGGGLAAALALMVRDLGEVNLAGQILMYPMLDHRTGDTDDVHRNPTSGEFTWTRASNRFCWAAVRGNYDLGDERLGWFSPSRVADLSNLPPAYIAVGALDLFLDEDIAYALRLSHAGVPVECHVYPGVIHGSETWVPEAQVSQQITGDQRRAVARLLRAAPVEALVERV